MIKIIKAKDRHFSDFGWLKTFWLFSFAEYYDPDNIQFGALRVFNDDVVEPGTGFPTHPHHEMEIITLVLEGEMTHRDSMGNKTVIRAGDVQRMSAGTGLTHSEYNLSDDPVHFYQVWIYPDQRGLKPSYDQKLFNFAKTRNQLLPVASGQVLKDTVIFHTDATIYIANLDKGQLINHATSDKRRLFVYVTKGTVEINNTRLEEKEQARIDSVEHLNVKALDDAGLVIIDVPSCKGFGYDKKTLSGK